ncbi:MAG TPA: hypothetical protein VFW68_09820 [Rhodocyclaceae bacterium]|nr:hypothetical protein [Rhodocyclaceae bacterium]
MMRRFNNSLAHRTLRRLSGMMLLSVILAGVVLIIDTRSAERDRQAELLEKVGVAMAGPLSESVWMVDTPLLERQLKAMTEIPGVAHVAVTTFIGQEFHADKPGYKGSENFMVRRLQLRHQNDSLGQLEIWGDSDLLQSEIVGHVITILFILIVLLTAGVIGVYLAVHREVSVPLSVIARYLEKASYPDAPLDMQMRPLKDELPANTGRELVGVASAIDHLQQTLREQSSQE